MRSSLLAVAAATVVVAAGFGYRSGTGGIAEATPASGISQTLVATGLFEPFELKRKRENWEIEIEVEGLPTIISYQSSLAGPGATTGWHSHPGPVFITVTEGEVTVYNAEDPSCTPRRFTQGQGIIEPRTVHVLRNEASVPARWTSANIRPADQPARFDAPAPGHCPF